MNDSTEFPTTAALDAELRRRERPADNDYSDEAIRWRIREERRRRREHPSRFLSDDELEALVAALEVGDTRTAGWIERRCWRRVRANLYGRRRPVPGIPREGQGFLAEPVRCVFERNPGNDPDCSCVEWWLIGPSDGRFSSPSDIHYRRERVREKRRMLREAPAQPINPKLPGTAPPEPMPVPVPGRLVRGLVVIDGGLVTSSGEGLRLPEVVSSTTTNGGRRP